MHSTCSDDEESLGFCQTLRSRLHFIDDTTKDHVEMDEVMLFNTQYVAEFFSCGTARFELKFLSSLQSSDFFNIVLR